MDANEMGAASHLWTDGLIFGFERIHQPGPYAGQILEDGHWVPIGWTRIYELVQSIQSDAALEIFDAVANVASSSMERPVRSTWWCHVAAGHHYVQSWLRDAKWLHTVVSLALRDANQLIDEKMKYLFREININTPVRVAGGLLFELLGKSFHDPSVDEDDIPIVLRSWQTEYFLITSLHVVGHVQRMNVLGIDEVQELLSGGGDSAPKTVHEVIAQLASSLARWDDRLFRKSIFAMADEIEVNFMTRRNNEEMQRVSITLNQKIQSLSKQAIMMKWSLHAREEIIFELLQHLKGNASRMVLEGIRERTRGMMEELETVRGRLLTIQDVIQSTVRAWLQDKSLRVTHNLAVFGGCGLVLSLIIGLFGIYAGIIPGAKTPYAFSLFTAVFCFIGLVLMMIGVECLGLKKPIIIEQIEEKLELEELIKILRHERTGATCHQPASFQIHG